MPIGRRVSRFAVGAAPSRPAGVPGAGPGRGRPVRRTRGVGRISARRSPGDTRDRRRRRRSKPKPASAKRSRREGRSARPTASLPARSRVRAVSPPLAPNDGSDTAEPARGTASGAGGRRGVARSSDSGAIVDRKGDPGHLGNGREGPRRALRAIGRTLDPLLPILAARRFLRPKHPCDGRRALLRSASKFQSIALDPRVIPSRSTVAPERPEDSKVPEARIRSAMFRAASRTIARCR